ncbi:MAG TPA: hypothetical protein VHZ55_33605 [Bryobacteraceae bacterium]|nr:hypothetical protein [Bryobacteraceae bacterium]
MTASRWLTYITAQATAVDSKAAGLRHPDEFANLKVPKSWAFC